MESTKDDALRLLKKLFQFNESNCTPEEFALAGQRIKAILEKYQLSMSDIRVGTTSELVGEAVMQLNRKNIKGWERLLAYQIATAFDCKAYSHPMGATTFHGPTYHMLIFIGMKSDVEVCQYFYQMCSTKLCEAGKKKGKERCYWGSGLTTYINSFMMGAAQVIGHRLQKHYVSDQPEQRNALVVMKTKMVDEYVEKLDARKPTARPRMNMNHEGTWDGAREAHRMELSRGIEGSEKPAELTYNNAVV